MSSVVEWFRSNTDVQVHQALSVDKSLIDGIPSGSGLFVDLSMVDHDLKGDTIELLRIPRLATFNLDTVLELIGDENQYKSTENMEKLYAKVRVVFARLLELNKLKESLNETILLIFYFTFLALVRDEYEIPKIIRVYLENVLLQVEVDNASMFFEETVDVYGQYSTFAALGDVLQLLESFFKENVIDSSSLVPLLKRVSAAISSRCLEIPDEFEEGSEDFVVNTALVPLLDFANHSNDLKNAYFDVDRQTKDVLLLLDVDQIPDDVAKFEVFISYSPNEDLFCFIYSYGFLPSAIKEKQLLNISFDRDYLKKCERFPNVNLRLFYKWMRINPVVQLIKSEDCWYINDSVKEFAFILLAFMHSPDNSSSSCWTYDPACYRTLWYFQEHSEKRKARPLSLGAYKEMTDLLQDDDNDFIDLPQLAWSMSFQGEDLDTHRGRFSKEQALEIAPFDNERIFNDAIELFTTFFIDYLKWRLTKLEEFRSQISSSALRQLIEAETDILSELIHETHLYYWSDQGADAESFECNLRPLSSRRHCAMNIEALEETSTLENLSVDDYCQENFTDFLEEELELYADLV